jgi:hypothetical protein
MVRKLFLMVTRFLSSVGHGRDYLTEQWRDWDRQEFHIDKETEHKRNRDP